MAHDCPKETTGRCRYPQGVPSAYLPRLPAGGRIAASWRPAPLSGADRQRALHVSSIVDGTWRLRSRSKEKDEPIRNDEICGGSATGGADEYGRGRAGQRKAIMRTKLPGSMRIVSGAIAVLVAAVFTSCVGSAMAEEEKASGGPKTKPSSCILEGAKLPQPIDLRDIHASGPLDELLKKSYAHLSKGPVGFGSDWSDPNEPGDGRGRWMIAMCNYGAYLHEKPQKMLDEMQRMRQMRNAHGFFGLDKPVEVVQAQASYDNSWPIQWGIDYTRYFGDTFGLDFARSIADAFYVAKLPFYEPYAEQPKGHWMGEYGHSGIGLGGMVGVARLGKVTGADRYAKAARGLADLLLHTNYIGWHGHATSTAVLGLLYTYELTGDRRDPDAAVQAVDKVFLGYEMPYMGHAGGLYKGVDHSEGCGVADYFRLNMELGRLTGKALFRQGRADPVGAVLPSR